MDAMDRYIERLSDPAVRSYWRKLRLIDEDEPGPDESKASEEHVSTAEETLGVALPPSYRKLVTATHPHDGVYGVYWVWDEEADQFIADIVSTRQDPHSPLPPFLIAVVGEDGGDEFCFDVRHPDERCEYPIVHFDPGIHHEESTEFETVAK